MAKRSIEVRFTITGEKKFEVNKGLFDLIERDNKDDYPEIQQQLLNELRIRTGADNVVINEWSKPPF